MPRKGLETDRRLTMHVKRLFRWLQNVILSRPRFYIGGADNPYMIRWYLLPRNRWLNLYLHKFCRDDDDRALHDHPWWFVSLMLAGQYTEWTAAGEVIGPHVGVDKRRGSIAFRSSTHRHRISLPRDDAGKPIPCWTLVLTGPKVRTWGFWCPKGFVPWQEFVAEDDHGNIGRGCE